MLSHDCRKHLCTGYEGNAPIHAKSLKIEAEKHAKFKEDKVYGVAIKPNDNFFALRVHLL